MSHKRAPFDAANSVKVTCAVAQCPRSAQDLPGAARRVRSSGGCGQKSGSIIPMFDAMILCHKFRLCCVFCSACRGGSPTPEDKRSCPTEMRVPSHCRHWCLFLRASRARSSSNNAVRAGGDRSTGVRVECGERLRTHRRRPGQHDGPLWRVVWRVQALREPELDRCGLNVSGKAVLSAPRSRTNSTPKRSHRAVCSVRASLSRMRTQASKVPLPAVRLPPAMRGRTLHAHVSSSFASRRREGGASLWLH